MPLDIFVPFWGDPGMLRETVASVLAQRNSDWKLTVIDDDYPDDSVPAFFAEFDDPRVTYVRNESNQGITEYFRRCVARATEDVVVIVGCDDQLLPNYVDVILNAHRAFPDAAIIQPGVRVIDEHGRVILTLADTVKQRLAMPHTTGRRILSGEKLAVSLLRADWLYWPSLAFRRDILQSTPFRDGLPVIQDLALVVDVVWQVDSCCSIPLCASPMVDTMAARRSQRHSTGAGSGASVTTSIRRPHKCVPSAGPAPSAQRVGT
jgi:glycosyltransferase involved in cell wall biosynthesis